MDQQAIILVPHSSSELSMDHSKARWNPGNNRKRDKNGENVCVLLIEQLAFQLPCQHPGVSQSRIRIGSENPRNRLVVPDTKLIRQRQVHYLCLYRYHQADDYEDYEKEHRGRVNVCNAKAFKRQMMKQPQAYIGIINNKNNIVMENFNHQSNPFRCRQYQGGRSAAVDSECP